MKKYEYILKSLPNALGVFLYISAIAFFFANAQNIFGNEEDNFLIPVFMLLLFVISASITGLLVLGKPIFLYLNGLKKEGFIMLFATLGWLIVFLFAVVAFLILR
ncbi:MAG: hypothetical protein Q8P11_03200 [bacterium]|nr:hypothetical protein [bacterium]